MPRVPHACLGSVSFPHPLQLLLAVCEKSTPIGTSCQGAMLPSITNVINLADSHDRAAFAMVTHVKQEPRERENSESKEEVRPCTPRAESQRGGEAPCPMGRILGPAEEVFVSALDLFRA